MLEFLLCSMVTLLPDYLFRRYGQGKRWGHELNLFSMWYELRWGLTACVLLTLSLITAIFYYHPATTNVLSAFRTVTILSEGGGRVEQVYVTNGQAVKSGDPIFRLDGSSQEAAADTARARIAEVDATIVVTLTQLEAAEAQLDRAEAALEQAEDEFERKNTLFQQNSAAVAAREVERLENLVDEREAGVDAAEANIQTVTEQLDVLLPAQKASAEASLAQAEAELAKLLIVAGVDGQVEQFTLRVGDYVNPILRPAGLLIPADAGRNRFQAGFGQIASQVVKPGMLAEMTCVPSPMKIIPMIVVDVQDAIPAGQIRPSDALIDFQDRARPGTITAFLEPLYEGSTDHIPPGSKCIVNGYTNNHERLQNEEMGTGKRVVLHTIDTVGLAHAFILRIQSILLPVRTLVLSGHH